LDSRHFREMAPQKGREEQQEEMYGRGTEELCTKEKEQKWEGTRIP